MNSSRRKKKKQCLVRADPMGHGPYVSVETRPTIDDILWSVGNNLAASHTDQSGRRGQLHTFKTAKYETRAPCVCAWACGRARMDGILCEDWLWSRGYRGAELAAICCLLLGAAGQQSAMLIDHLFNVQNETNTFRAAHAVHELTKCSSSLSQQTVYIKVKGISTHKDRWKKSDPSLSSTVKKPRRALRVAVHVPQTRWSVLSNQWLLNHDGSFHSSTNHGPAGYS